MFKPWIRRLISTSFGAPSVERWNSTVGDFVPDWPLLSFLNVECIPSHATEHHLDGALSARHSHPAFSRFSSSWSNFSHRHGDCLMRREGSYVGMKLQFLWCTVEGPGELDWSRRNVQIDKEQRGLIDNIEGNSCVTRFVLRERNADNFIVYAICELSLDYCEVYRIICFFSELFLFNGCWRFEKILYL